MASRTIDVHLRTNADTGPLEKFRGTLESLSGTAKGLGGVVASVTSKFGTWGEVVGGVFRNFMRGGIWGVMATAIQEIWTRWKDASKDAAEKASEAVKKSAVEIKTALDSINKEFTSGVSSVDKYTSRLEKQIDTTKRLAIAEKELEKQRALAANDSIGAAKADEDIAVINAKSEEAKEAARVKGYEQRRKLASDATKKAETEYDKAVAEAAKISARRDAMIGRPGTEDLNNPFAYRPDTSTAWGRAEQRAQVWADKERTRRTWNRAAGPTAGEAWLSDIRGMRNRYFAEERKKLYKSDEWKDSSKDLKTATEAISKASATHLEMRQQLADIEAEEKRRLDENAAKKLESVAKSVSAERDAAKERDRLDRELHQKRMADLRAEIAAQREAANPLRATAAAAATEFERAFAMYRDPSLAASEIEEERDRSADLKRLHKDASRYGGKWRIDELSQLMSAGDSQGVQSRLEEWRKRKSFTPEVEAMVRASAAEQTKTTAEDELRKIEANTKDLAQKLESLIAMKGGE